MDFASLYNHLKVSHDLLGHSLGFKLFYMPLSVFNDHNYVVFLGLNPGSSGKSAHCTLDSDCCAYSQEAWGFYEPGQSPLQIQVQRMFSLMRPDQGLHKSVRGNLIPFRSKDFPRLIAKDNSLKIGSEIWNIILDHCRPKLIVGMSGIVGDFIRNKYGIDYESMPTGWGNVQAKCHVSSSMRVFILPHLSRFKIFTSDKCRSFNDEFQQIVRRA